MTAISSPKTEHNNSDRTVALIWRIFFTIFFLMAAGIIGFVSFRPILVLPRITLAPGFRLTDHQGNQLSNEMLRGSIVLYTFTYSRCSPPCVQTAETMTAVHEQLANYDDQGVPIKMVTLSFDPAYDTPEVLAAMAAQTGADAETWWYATGSPVEMRSIIGGGFSTYFKAQVEGDFKFDPAFMIVDGNGILRAEYRIDIPEADILMRDIDLLVNEAVHSRGASRVAYEAAHLFLCYPQ